MPGYFKLSEEATTTLFKIREFDYPSKKLLSEKILSQKLPPNHFLPENSYPKTPIIN